MIDSEYLNHDHEVSVGFIVIACPNKNCKELTFTVRLTGSRQVNPSDTWGSTDEEDKTTLAKEWLLLPESTAKPQPSYIPEPIREDYTEACKIKTLSPKASATLARRCLQGMIRDFHGITKQNLK